MSEVFKMELSSPITDEEWAFITDAELERTSEITFITPSGKKVVFIKKPTVDAVEVVRCKDCRHWVGEYRYQEYGRNYKKCEVTPYLRTEESHFCAMGERREERKDD